MDNRMEQPVSGDCPADSKVSEKTTGETISGSENITRTDSVLATEAKIEALLFAAGRAVESEELAEACGMDRLEMREACEKLAERWNREKRGTEIIALEDAWQMRTRKEFYPELIALELHPKKPSLTDVLLETLSVIAYRQPVTKSEIERIRGVNSDHAVNRLIEFGLIQELGRAKLPGRPILFGTTQEFLRVFGVRSRETLPEISSVKLEDFREEAEREAGEKNPETSGETADAGSSVQESGKLPILNRDVDGEIGVEV